MLWVGDFGGTAAVAFGKIKLCFWWPVTSLTAMANWSKINPNVVLGHSPLRTAPSGEDILHNSKAAYPEIGTASPFFRRFIMTTS